MKYLMLLTMLSWSLSSCISTNSDNISQVSATGVIEPQGITTYQYGTHILVNGNSTTYALRSNTLDLDNYVNQYVTIKGEKVPGYPVDGGPEYLEVKEVK